MKNTKYGCTDIKIHLAGKTAWARFKYTISADVTDNGKTRHVDGGGLGTALLEQRDGRWQIVHWHSSAPRRAPATATPPKNP
ncbi:MAG TPA: nuclear transport factor 2 family protein [Pyrinomonadaceae bacterium]|nr:nuclear transport factor 2 family protein [Pyrinomonadaceae bacterium]